MLDALLSAGLTVRLVALGLIWSCQVQQVHFVEACCGETTEAAAQDIRVFTLRLLEHVWAWPLKRARQILSDDFYFTGQVYINVLSGAFILFLRRTAVLVIY